MLIQVVFKLHGCVIVPLWIITMHMSVTHYMFVCKPFTSPVSGTKCGAPRSEAGGAVIQLTMTEY